VEAEIKKKKSEIEVEGVYVLYKPNSDNVLPEEV